MGGWRTLHGEQQIIFVTGEPGIGKTTLLEAFLQSLESRVPRLASEDDKRSRSKIQTLDPKRQTLDGHLWVGRGLCVEHYGPGEAYLPILDALGRLCRGPEGKTLIRLLNQHAPTWLVQMPTLLSAADLEVLQSRVQGATRERMLREMAEAVEALTVERPLVLVLEDLQWSDYSTLDLLSFLARRREAARLLVIGTYRPMEVLGGSHPLQAMKQELQAHGQCAEFPLELLTETAVADYLAGRFAVGGHDRADLHRLACLIHRRTEGNPLFMVNAVDYVLTQDVLTPRDGAWELQTNIKEITIGIPESLRQLIEKHLARLAPEEQRVLEAASVVGVEFSVAAVAAGIGDAVVQVEQVCAALARRGQFLRTDGVEAWSDGTVAGRYQFLHALYQEVLDERLSPGQRMYLHQKIGERKEAGYGERTREIATELAVHFEQGRDYKKAVEYLQHTAENALWRYAYREAIDHLTKGLGLLRTLPDTPERYRQELILHIMLAAPWMALKGDAAPEAKQAYVRAQELCKQMGEPPELFWVLTGLWAVSCAQGRLQEGRELGGQLMHFAQKEPAPLLLLWAHHALGLTLSYRGELTSALSHLEQVITLYDPQQHRFAIPDPKVICLFFASFVLWLLGYPDQALKKSEEAFTLAQELSYPFILVFALHCIALVYQFRREIQTVQERAEALITLSTDHGFSLREIAGTILRGWALAEQGQTEEGIAQINNGLADWQATGVELGRPTYLAWLAEAYRKAGQVKEGLTIVAEALAVIGKTGERWAEPELYRLKGELTLQKFQVSGFKFPTPYALCPTPQPRRRPKRVFSRLSTLLAKRAQRCWSCGQRQV